MEEQKITYAPREPGIFADQKDWDEWNAWTKKVQQHLDDLVAAQQGKE